MTNELDRIAAHREKLQQTTETHANLASLLGEHHNSTSNAIRSGSAPITPLVGTGRHSRTAIDTITRNLGMHTTSPLLVLVAREGAGNHPGSSARYIRIRHAEHDEYLPRDAIDSNGLIHGFTDTAAFGRDRSPRQSRLIGLRRDRRQKFGFRPGGRKRRPFTLWPLGSARAPRCQKPIRRQHTRGQADRPSP